MTTPTCLKTLVEQLQEKIRRLTKLLDDQFGTPCEQIRHKQEIEAIIERCTTPTPARIEAAIKAMQKLWVHPTHAWQFKPMAEAALTAAAQVGEPPDDSMEGAIKRGRQQAIAEEYAQAEEQTLDCGCGYDDPSDVCMVHEPIVKLHVAATIERCVQVVREMADNIEKLMSQDHETHIAHEMLRAAVAKIHKLKDEV